jgi:hypothetical protein
MTLDEAIEKVARAIAKERRLDWERITETAHDALRGEARAAMLAMIDTLDARWEISKKPMWDVVEELRRELSGVGP